MLTKVVCRILAVEHADVGAVDCLEGKPVPAAHHDWVKPVSVAHHDWVKPVSAAHHNWVKPVPTAHHLG